MGSDGPEKKYETQTGKCDLYALLLDLEVWADPISIVRLLST